MKSSNIFESQNDNHIDSVKKKINHELFLLQEEKDNEQFKKYPDIDLNFKFHENYSKFEENDYFYSNMSLNL